MTPTRTPRRPVVTVDIVLAPARIVAAATGAVELLDDAERERLSRLRHPADRLRFVAGRVLVRELVAERTGVAARLVALRVDGRGRPRVVAPTGAPDVSISHARGVVAVAIATGGRVGIDLEARPADADRPALERVALAPEERRRAQRLRPEVRAERALRAWAVKEAYGKLTGRGIALAPDELTVARVAGRPVALRTLRLGIAGEPFRLAVAAWSPASPGDRPELGLSLHGRGALAPAAKAAA